MNEPLKSLYKASIFGAIGVLDVSIGLLKLKPQELKTVKESEPTLEIERHDITNLILGIKKEMNEELDDLSENQKLLKNFARGRIATCDDLLIRLNNFFEDKNV